MVMHWRGQASDMNSRAVYGDVVAEVVDELRRRFDAVVAAGVAAERIMLDPGLGFAKNAEHNWALLARLDRLRELGRPLLVGGLPQALPGPAAGRPGPGSRAPARHATRRPRPSRRSRPARAPGRCGCTTCGDGGRRPGRGGLAGGRGELTEASRVVAWLVTARATGRRRDRWQAEPGGGRWRPTRRSTTRVENGDLEAIEDGLAAPPRSPATSSVVIVRAPRLAGAARPRPGAAVLRADHGEHRRTSSSS